MGNRQSGFSLIEILFAMAIMCLLVVSFAQVTQQEASAQRKTSQKFDTLDLKQGLQTTMMNSANCDCQLAALPPFDGTKPNAFIEMTRIKQGCVPTAPDLVVANTLLPNSQTLKASTVRLAKINKTGTDQYTGVFQVAFDSSSTAIVWRNVEVTQVFQTDPATPPTALKITGCGASLAGPPPNPYRTYVSCSAPNNYSAICATDIYTELQLFRYGVKRSDVTIKNKVQTDYVPAGCGPGNSFCHTFIMGMVNGVIQTTVNQSSQIIQVDVAW